MAGALYAALEAGPKTKRERLQQTRDALWSERSSYDAHWREIADFLVPTRTRFTASQRNQGGKRNQNIIDSTGRFALRTLQSGLHAGMTSPARPWFTLTTPDRELAKFKPVQAWLHEVTELMRMVFTDTNLYNTFPTVYGDLGLFGTAAMSMVDDTEDVFRAAAHPLGSYALAMDDRGIACTFVREYERSVLQVVEAFGVKPGYRDIDWSRISQSVKSLWDQGNYEAPIEVTWVVQKNIGQDTSRIGHHAMPYSSCHFEKGASDNKILRESGFSEFPIMAPRWDITGEDTYGTDCPGMIALGDVKQLQGMTREMNKAIAKKVSPPMVGTPELRTQKTSIISGDITYVREPQHGFRAAHEVNLDLGDIREEKREIQCRIQRAFFEDLFLMIARGDDTEKTAAEIAARQEEKLIALGPMHDRANDELLDRVVDRCYSLLERRGLLPEAPEELQGVKLEVEYQSIMAQAQKLIGINGQDRFLRSAAPLVEIDPSLRFKINGQQIIDNLAEMTGLDPRCVRSNEEADALAKAEAEQVAAAQQAEQAMQLARAGKDASQAPIGGPGGQSMLDAVLGGSGTVQ